jgi:DNA-binding transcriptional LysR family regulator
MAFDGRLLSGVSILASVVEAGSFAKTAENLGMSPSGVSRAIARLEGQVGIRLLDRNTRSLRLTAEGALFYEEVMPHLEGIEIAAGRASGSANRVYGRLRINVDTFFSALVMAPHLPAFCQQYPDLEIEIYTRDAIGDLISDGMDVAVRFGPQPNSSLVARRLLETRILTLAAPSYLARRGTPTKPEDLATHSCLQFRDPSTGHPFDWEFHRGKMILPVTTRGPLLLTDVSTMLTSCLAGAGIAQVMSLGIQPLLESGALIELFPDWPGEVFPLYAIYPSKRHPAAKVRAFLDFCLKISSDVSRVVHDVPSVALPIG